MNRVSSPFSGDSESGRQLIGVALPSIAVPLLMLVAYAGVGGAIALGLTSTRPSLAFGIASVFGMLVLPHFVVGVAVGFLRGVDYETAIAMGLAPLVFFVFAMAVVGGPIFEFVGAPLLTIVVTLVWIGLSLAGMAGGRKLGDRASGQFAGRLGLTDSSGQSGR